MPLPESAIRRLTIILSDCVGQAWSKGDLLRSLEPLAETAPLTIVQMLPQRLWADCGIHFVPVQVGAHRGENGAVRLWAGPRPGYPNMGGEGVPIPVLELDDRWLAPWASLIAGETTSPIAGMAVHSRSARDVVQSRRGDRAARPGRAVPLGSVTDRTAPSLILGHRAAQLAGLATAPVDDDARISSCGPCGGLPQRTAASRPSAPPGEDWISTSIRVCEKILLASMPRAEVLRVFRSVCQIVGDRFGTSLAFTTFFAECAGASWSKPDPGLNISISEPFASIAITVFRCVGGRYWDIAAPTCLTVRRTVLFRSTCRPVSAA